MDRRGVACGSLRVGGAIFLAQMPRADYDIASAAGSCGRAVDRYNAAFASHECPPESSRDLGSQDVGHVFSSWVIACVGVNSFNASRSRPCWPKWRASIACIGCWARFR